MLPLVFIGDVTGTGGGVTQSFAVPAATKPGDKQIAIIAVAPQISHVDVDDGDNPYGWEELAAIALTSATIIVARRTALDDDPDTLTLKVTAAATWVMSAMETYRGDLDTTAAVGAAGADVAASTSFACPSQNLARYSDLYLGIAVVTSAGVAVTPPAGTTERHEHSAAGRTLQAFDLLPETPGATGVKAATTGANQTGSAASIALTTTGLIGGKSLTDVSPVPGMLGLPMWGV